MLAEQAKRLAQLQADGAQKEQELGKLRSALRAIEDRSNKLQASSSHSDAQLLALSQERDSLTTQLQSLNQSYGIDRTELANLRLEHDKTLIRTASLEAKISELASQNKDQERRLKDTDQYLSSDRDIRELMGARKLYIADVFDVDGSSRTKNRSAESSIHKANLLFFMPLIWIVSQAWSMPAPSRSGASEKPLKVSRHRP